MIIAPYAVWMLLMMALSASAGNYAIRTGATALTLVVCTILAKWRPKLNWAELGWGVAAGLFIFVIWVAPENFAWYRRYLTFGGPDSWYSFGPAPAVSPYDPAVCGWTLTLIRLFGSAFIIAIAEELFFRKWLVDFAGFWWMVALFAIEHDRWLVGAICGIVYGVLAIKKGLGSAIIAHITTNFTLGLWVIFKGNWSFW